MAQDHATVLRRDDEEGWTLLTMQRPERRNALSIELRDAISDELDALAADESVHGVVITGSDGVFSAGWDLDEFRRAADDPDLAERIWTSGDRFHHTVLGFPLPLVAAIDGPALAGAFDLAICCDVRLAATTARFGHPEFQWSDVLYAPLEAVVGGAVARDLLLTGRDLDAREALAVGLVSFVVPPDQLADLVATTMRRVAAAPRAALVRTKSKAIERAGIDLGRSLDL
jgi:enoyl-CoA hydratase/carnithine racemase